MVATPPLYDEEPNMYPKSAEELEYEQSEEPTNGKVMLVSPLHPANAPLPILVTLLGTTTEVRPIHPEKALLPILFTLSGIEISVNDAQFANVP